MEGYLLKSGENSVTKTTHILGHGALLEYAEDNQRRVKIAAYEFTSSSRGETLLW